MYVKGETGKMFISFVFFSLYLHDLVELLLINGYHGIEMYMFKICLLLLLYANDIVIFPGLQIGFNILKD